MVKLDNTRAGFSIMETLVSVALLSIAIIPLYTLQQTLAQSAARLQETTERVEAQESAIAYLETLDIYASPEGQTELGEWTLSWTSQVIAFEENADGYLGPGLYSIGLFEISARLERGTQQYDYTVRRVGWLQTRSGFS